MTASRPAAGATLAFLELLQSPENAAFSSLWLFGILDPADELVAGQRRNVLPGSERRAVRQQLCAHVIRKLMDHTTRHLLAVHKTTLAASWAVRQAPNAATTPKSSAGANARWRGDEETRPPAKTITATPATWGDSG